jgi:hypothetical protein
MSRIKNLPFPDQDQGQIFKQVFNDARDRLRTEIELTDSSNSDAFGRLRVSNPELVFESIHKYDKQPLLWDETIAGTGTSTHDINQSAVLMAVGTASGDSVVRQTKRYCAYYPGKSQLVMMTGNMGGMKANVRQRIGYFDVNNGVFFEMNGTTLRVVQRSGTSGSPVDTAVNQADWNIDKMDGTGDSGITLDMSKSQIFMIDLEWLGVGRVRCGFIIGGRFVQCHEFNNANSIVGPYMTTAKLPLRYEIVNTGTSASTTTMYHICGTVITEGGKATGGIVRSVNNGTTYKTANGGNRVPLITIRLKSANNRASLVPLKFEIINSNATDFRYELVLNGTLTGASFNGALGYAELDTAATSINTGTTILSGYSLGNVQVSTVDLADILTSVESDIAGTSDILSVVITPISNTTAMAALTYREIV